ncbi:bifunctional hydroxymethylpyrimidine kinase/phosphomethylpyrimidine kinase [Vagococcus elongatus]|uniref:bifunctional hydroxymethylpyrimidine kinase/phosphomethylpyrimidine kinase n=1 Tax=Vagococcus elongatus TaxID=180344 RepID=UPI001B863E22|nr:bifunctional hydroxymethylpyrimidine kinase/phosphomethylpyrimidine kinase [Vagococcus elongatus]
MKKTLTIAGSDSSGGAGIQADLKTFQEFGTFGFCAITSVVTMDPDNNWSHHVTSMEPALVEQQLKTIFSGKPIDGLKTGMLGAIETIEIAARYIKKHQVKHVVIDPVMACKGSDELLQPENVETMKKLLLPLATIATPNLLEAKFLANVPTISSLDDMKQAAEKILELGPKTVVIKGGKALGTDKAIDVFYDGKEFTVLSENKIQTHNNHGAGCTFAAAITAGLTKGLSTEKAARQAKSFVTAAIKNGVDIYPYVGHIWHGAYNHAEKRIIDNN